MPKNNIGVNILDDEENQNIGEIDFHSSSFEADDEDYSKWQEMRKNKSEQ